METRPLRMITGKEIVERGRIVTNCNLPEVGPKEVTPNKSWLETKQVQYALEARKKLVAAERIDKVGSLSHAVWRDEQGLAEVTQQVGGHWQYLGHMVNGSLFLMPEEALFLIETNCLLLKHNHVTVSLQKAYNLLLNNNLTLTQYKVYAWLSRIGYKVLRHNISEVVVDLSVRSKNNPPDLTEAGISSDIQMLPSDAISENLVVDVPMTSNEDTSNKESDMIVDIVLLPSTSNDNETFKTPLSNNIPNKESNMDISMLLDLTLPKSATSNSDVTNIVTEIIETETVLKTIDPGVVLSIDIHGVIRCVTEEDSTNTVEMIDVSPAAKKPEICDNMEKLMQFYKMEQIKMKNRKVKASDPQGMQERFKDIPDCYDHQVITVKVPHEMYLPRNVFLNNTSYVLNLQTLKSNRRRNSAPRTLENRATYRPLRNTSESDTAVYPIPAMHSYPTAVPILQRPFGYGPVWRTRTLPYLQRPQFPRHFNPYWYNVNFMPNTFNINRPPVAQMPNQSQSSRKKRQHGLNVKNEHLRAIMEFAVKLKQFAVPPNNSLNSLLGLMNRFNEIYSERMRITADLDVIDDNLANIETIELDDDEVPAKKPRLSCAKFDNYLNNVKALATRLKNLERKNQSTSKHRRVFYNLLKNFNETYDTDFHLDSKGKLIDKKLVVLDSSSDSDTIVTDDKETTKEKKRTSSDNEYAPKNKKRKILRNPFNVLKKVNEGASTSQAVLEDVTETTEITIENNSIDLTKYFSNNWLPNKDDFGSVNLSYDKDSMMNLYAISQQLYAYMDDPGAFKNWVDLKLTIYAHIESILTLENDLVQSTDLKSNKSCLKPLLIQNPCHDWPTMLESLRIIKSDATIQETNLRIDFDVYNRDVQNFRKTDPPKPHFRLVCVDESSQFPSHGEVGALQAKYNDNVTMVFGVVGVGSVTFLRLDSKEIPIHLGDDDDED